ncbi:MAG: tetratricopeptide repeat protein [Deltaproteobacteria bacterium]|nr:tetratricopeptide repeat protein [Deltaproteobacteria bacterium]
MQASCPRVFIRRVSRWAAPLVTLVACRPSQSPAEPATARATAPPRPQPKLAPTAARPAFILLQSDETTVVPVDPTAEIRTLPGLWVGGRPGGDAAAWGVVEVELSTMLGPEAPSLPVCPRGDFGDACVLPLDLQPDDPMPQATLASASSTVAVRVRVDSDGTPHFAPEGLWNHDPCSCITVYGISTDGDPVPEFDLEDPETLAEIEMSPYDVEEYEQECGTDALRPDYATTAVLGGRVYLNGMMSSNVCNGLNIYDGTRESWALRPGATELELTFPPSVHCSDTELWDAHESSFEEDAYPPHPDQDDPSDDCDTQWPEMLSFRLYRGRLVRAIGNIGTVGHECSCSSWIPAKGACPSPLDPCGDPRVLASDGNWRELWVATDETVGLGIGDEELAVLRPGQPKPVRRAPALDDIIGVEFHPDSVLATLPDIPVEFRPALPTPDPADDQFDGSARAWGNRCFSHIKAGQLDAAEAACFYGLVVGGSDGTRGALAYNLGRIEEARGDRDRALAYYERSNDLRPGNTTVEARLKALHD